MGPSRCELIARPLSRGIYAKPTPDIIQKIAQLALHNDGAKWTVVGKGRLVPPRRCPPGFRAVDTTTLKCNPVADPLQVQRHACYNTGIGCTAGRRAQ